MRLARELLADLADVSLQRGIVVDAHLPADLGVLLLADRQLFGFAEQRHLLLAGDGIGRARRADGDERPQKKAASRALVCNPRVVQPLYQANSGPFPGLPTADRPVLETSSSPSSRCETPCRPAGPRPAPISMLKCCSRYLRTAASSTPCGTVTAFSVHRRSPGDGQQRQSEWIERFRRTRLMVLLVPRPARLQSFFFDAGERFAQRVDQRRGHRVVILAPHPVVLEQRDDRNRNSGTPPSSRARAARTRSATSPTARRGISGCSCRRHRVPNPPHRAACRRATSPHRR